ncbi:SsgA family sporulation/cell division regulator [Nocardioides sp. Bht2]|uniref:SsgA family sporulation/cell division regulator n=1 Tax=Nocardioides sp. Bht2 TaxID=3392297 RepID=UPI0039B63401
MFNRAEGGGSSVRQSVTMHCVDVGVAAALDVDLGYSEHDPYAVTASFQTEYGEVVWTFARDLLIRGLTRPVGDGDVEVWPAVGMTGAAMVRIEFRSPDGELLVETPSRGITAFVNQSMQVVPLGEESAHLDVDDLIDQLLGV